jgi:hypothetical protein
VEIENSKDASAQFIDFFMDSRRALHGNKNILHVGDEQKNCTKRDIITVTYKGIYSIS